MLVTLLIRMSFLRNQLMTLNLLCGYNHYDLHQNHQRQSPNPLSTSQLCSSRQYQEKLSKFTTFLQKWKNTIVIEFHHVLLRFRFFLIISSQILQCPLHLTVGHELGFFVAVLVIYLFVQFLRIWRVDLKIHVFFSFTYFTQGFLQLIKFLPPVDVRTEKREHLFDHLMIALDKLEVG